MIVVNPKSVHLLKGYLLASQAESQLQNRWRAKLQTAFAKRQQKYETAASQREKEKQATNRDILTGVIYVLGGVGISVVCFLVPLLFHSSANFWKIVGAITLTLTSMLGTGLGVFWLIQLTLPKPQPPANPFQSDIFSPILPQWKTALKTSLPPAIQAGDVGEHAFIRNLQLMLGNDYFLLSGIQQRHGEDVDVVLIGPKGVWVFEVKYWSGTIRWRSGQWSRTKTYHAPGGIPTTEQKTISQPPDKQWQRVAADVSKSIQIRCPELGARYLGGIAIKGGLVFTHQEANYEIGPGVPIAGIFSMVAGPFAGGHPRFPIGGKLIQ
ncbi:MAG: NERD domain-containing protein [Ardenticatenaceae bacterium]|nr:NERD domain-containing protein [Ardenticatenaceae bacterium]